MAQHSPKISELVKLPGVGHGIAEKLVDAGVTTPVKLTMASIDTLCKAGMAENTAKKIREEAKKQVQARRDEKAESSEQPIFAYRFPCIMRTLPDGSKDVDWANLQEQAKERGTDEMRGVYIHCTALSGQRDLPWKVGKTKKVILDRIQTGDNKLLVRDILSDYNYNEKCNKDYVFYFIPMPKPLTNPQIESLESHLTSLAIKANPKVLECSSMERKVSTEHNANINFGAGIAGISHPTIGLENNGSVKGLTGNRRRDASMLARTLGVV
jgi:hypothetical protein